MISNLQKPIISGFDSKSDADKIVKEKDLSGKIAIVTGGYSGITIRSNYAGGGIEPSLNRSYPFKTAGLSDI